MHGLLKIAFLGPLLATLASSLPAQDSYIPGVNFRRFACAPLRTLPTAEHARYPARNRLSHDFLREWCPPSAPIVFPGQTLRWGNGRPLSPRHPVNPHRGLAVEGGSIPIIFPGQDHPLNSNLEPSSDVGFINSKMHPWLLNRWNQNAQSSRVRSEPRL